MHLMKLNQRGESIAEVMIALFMIALVSTVIATSVTISLRNTRMNRDRLVAEGLAREGFEAIVNMRDTNWLRFSHDSAECWNILPSVNECLSGDADSVIGPGSYRVALDTDTLAWILEDQADDLDLALGEDANAEYRLIVVDRNPDDDSDGDGDDQNDPDLYTHNPDGLVEKSSFFRMIQVACDDGTCVDDDHMTVASTVQWLHDDRIQNITIQDTVANSITE